MSDDEDSLMPSFDGVDTAGKKSACPDCSEPLSEHDKERVYGDDGPPGSYHYEYECP